MSRRDIELVTALAEGSLVDETEARALIEKSPRLRKVYEEQLLAFEALTTLPAATMTESEKAAMRRDVWTAFTTTSQEPVKAPVSRWAWGYAAVFVFALVGLVTVLNGGAFDLGGAATFSRSDQENSPTSGAGDPPSVTTIAPSSPAELEASRDLFSSWATTARQGLTAYRSAVTVDDVQQVSALTEWSSCVEELPIEDGSNYDVVDMVDLEGAFYAIATIRAAMSERIEVVIVDIDDCQIAYRD